ncbi:MAG: aminotransferase class III-fold pyridoxal phosphate-dependent enzyme [Parachlamydiaceae bacterium]|nr:aminotransferase class III-fold pyridoxal phosphate-dependent enzyme [Parachlamydiaceae bacterium]
MHHPESLIATQLKNDPRLIQAKKLLLETLEDYQKKITTIKPPNSELEQSYHELLETFMNLRGGKLYFPYIGSGIGKGALVELLDGSIKYDMISGIGAHFWGHNHPDLLFSTIDAALSDTIMQGHLQQNVDALELSELLISASGLDHCFLSSTGVMANENALKIAFQKKAPAHRVLAFEHCFMGRTLAMSQITDKPSFREGLPSSLHVDYIPFYNVNNPKESTDLAVSMLRKHLSRYPKQHAAMCFELVQGEGGFFPGTTEFFTALMKILKEHDIAIIIDEVQTFGRTPALFAFQYFNLQDYVDIVTVGKLSQVCSTLFRTNYKPQPGLLSQTFTSSTAAIQAAKVIINSLLQDNYFGPNGKIIKVHEHFAKNFKEIETKYPHLIKGPYGLGAMIAFTPYDGDFHRVTKFIHELFKAGVISFIAGSHPARVRFLVPMGAIKPTDIDLVTEIVQNVLLSDA